MFTKKHLEHFKTKKVFIHTHDFPDPDAFASAYGLQELLRYYGIESTICYGGVIERSSLLSMLKAFDITGDPRTDHTEEFLDAVNILVDSQLNNSNLVFTPGEDVYCIDHHPTFSDATYIWSDIRHVGACSSIIISYYKEANITMNQNVASALCYGLKMDTNDFNRGCTGFDIEMFNEVFEFCDYEKVTYINHNQLELSDFEAFKAAINNITTKGHFGFSYIPFQCPSTLIAIISDFLLSTEEVKISIVYSKLDDVMKLSVRCEEKGVSAGNLVHDALSGIGNGGGHPTMAGGVIFKESLAQMDNVEDEIIKRFLDAYKKETSSLPSV
ncbi:MAG: DHH family phosphoesterase [Lachnospiraceae bacterium]|nr:DHH family phosphoesterase [Lachnospiraceae bacterium]